MILKVNSYNPDLQRKGRVLASILLGLTAAGLMLAIFNVVQGETQYNVENGLFLSLMLGLFMLNRFGFVYLTSLLTIALSAAGAFLMADENLTTTYIALPLPVLVASYLLPSWSGFVVAALMIVCTIVFGIASPSLLILVILAIFSYLFADSIDRAYRETRYRALHDGLTGLPNRTLFIERLQQVINRSASDRNLCAVLFMDLDRFKIINDSLGHEAGNELLIAVAQRLQSCLRSTDTAARLGGDEFSVLLDDITEGGDAVRLGERIIKALEAPFEISGRQVFTSTSIGIALGNGRDKQPNTLLQKADVAMYEAKRKGKAVCEVFSEALHAKVLERAELENDLRRAIEHQELRVYYQPKVLLSTGRIAGMEALIRWEHPERGLLSPDEFIPLAEEAGLIIPLGRWVLREACRQAYAWQKQYPTTSSLVTSVNLSMKQFQEPRLIQELLEILRETKLQPHRLQLEITESMVTSDLEYATSLLRELRRIGVELAIDDFGTGYSSLASLRRFPVDDLKIDKAFVKRIKEDAQDRTIVEFVINLAHTIGVRATAEGVETAEQLAELQDMGCDQAQGYYFCEPLTGRAATAYLADSHYPLGQKYDSRIEHSQSTGLVLRSAHYTDPE